MNKLKFFLQEWKVIFLVFFITFVGLIYFDLQNTDIGFLQLHSLDEYTFHSSLQHMVNSVLTGNFSGLFGFSFYQYGFIYFFLNLLVALPGILTDNFSWAIFAPRALTSLFAIGSLIFIYKFSRLFIDTIPATIFTLIFISMPAFWFNATWFHPDWSMTFFLSAFIYFLAKDNWRFEKYFKLAVICFGLALAFKYQAITAIPLLGLYIFYDQIRELSITNLFLPIKRFLISIGVVFAIFILGNPYILHPMGWQAFKGSFLSNMESNATNHGAGTIVSFQEKINFALGDYYLNIIFIFILILSCLWLTWRFINKAEKSIFAIIAINFLINIGYLLLFVNKSWQMYYLPVMVIGLLSLLYFAKNITTTRQQLILSFILLCQIVIYSSNYYPILSSSRDAKAGDYSSYSKIENIDLNDFIIKSLQGYVNKNTNIIITPYTPFTFYDLDLKYEQVQLIFGTLNRSVFDKEHYLNEQKSYWGNLKSDEELLNSFKSTDIVILRKDIPFMSQLGESKKIVGELYNGSLGYHLLSENDFVVIFVKN